SSVSNASIPSPPYSPLQWEEWASQSDSSIVAPALGANRLDFASEPLDTNSHPGDGYNGYSAPEGDTPGGGWPVTQHGTMTSHTTPSTQPSVPYSAQDVEPLLVSETLIPPIASIQATDQHSNATPTSSLLDDTHSSNVNGPVQDNYVPLSRSIFASALTSNRSILNGSRSSYAKSPTQNVDHLLRSTFTNTLSSNVSLGSTHSSFANSPVQDITSSPHATSTKSL
ncbi:hypothetical protein P692DRAFT_20823936, partial [Suillus brevipes Sb2]